jgi:hypothetical protein
MNRHDFMPDEPWIDAEAVTAGGTPFEGKLPAN